MTRASLWMLVVGLVLLGCWYPVSHANTVTTAKTTYFVAVKAEPAVGEPNAQIPTTDAAEEWIPDAYTTPSGATIPIRRRKEPVLTVSDSDVEEVSIVHSPAVRAVTPGSKSVEVFLRLNARLKATCDEIAQKYSDYFLFVVRNGRAIQLGLAHRDFHLRAEGGAFATEDDARRSYAALDAKTRVVDATPEDVLKWQNYFIALKEWELWHVKCDPDYARIAGVSAEALEAMKAESAKKLATLDCKTPPAMVHAPS